MAKDQERARKIERAIRLAWSSLETHLPYTHQGSKCKPCDGGPAFQKQCVREYAELIKILSELF